MSVIDVDLVIVCSDQAHEGRTCNVAGFVRMDDGGWVRAHKKEPENESIWLADDRPAVEAEERPKVLRLRHNFRCRLCGLKVSARSEQLDPLLTVTAESGVRSIELARLARTLS